MDGPKPIPNLDAGGSNPRNLINRPVTQRGTNSLHRLEDRQDVFESVIRFGLGCP